MANSKLLSCGLCLLAIAVAANLPFRLGADPPPKAEPSGKEFLSLLAPGQRISTHLPGGTSAGRVDITIHPQGSKGTEKTIAEVGKDYVLVTSSAHDSRIAIPVWSISEINIISDAKKR